MFKKILASLLLAVICGRVDAKAYRADIPISDYITQLKFKLTSLRAEETALKNSLKLNPNLCVLFGSIGVCNLICYLAERSDWMSKSDAKGLRYGYAGSIIIYCWLKVLQYLFISADIEIVEEELDALQTKQ